LLPFRFNARGAERAASGADHEMNPLHEGPGRTRARTTNKKRPGRVGAVGELLVAADLMRRGHEVYRPVAADSTTDLLCLRRGSTRVIRIQVRARSSWNAYAAMPTRRDADVLAFVDLHGRVPAISYMATSRGSAQINTGEPDVTGLGGPAQGIDERI